MICQEKGPLSRCPQYIKSRPNLMPHIEKVLGSGFCPPPLRSEYYLIPTFKQLLVARRHLKSWIHPYSCILQNNNKVKFTLHQTLLVRFNCSLRQVLSKH